MKLTPRGWAIAIATVGLVVFAAWVVFDFGGTAATNVAADVGAVAGSAFALACAASVAWRARGRQRITWACLAVGVAGWLVGNGLLTVHHLFVDDGSRPWSAIDFCYVALPIGAIVAALFAPTARGNRFAIRLLLDGLIVSTSLFMIVWAVALQDLAEAENVSGVAFGLGVTYPFADLVAVTIGVMLTATSRSGYRLSPGLVTAGLAVIAASDGEYLYSFVSGNGTSDASVLGWATGTYLIGLGGLAAKVAPTPYATPLRSPSRAALWLPYVPVPFAIAVGAKALWPSADMAPLLATGLVLMAVSLLRQFILLDENRRLLVTVAEIALRDPLTGLSNRTLFADRLAHAIQLRQRNAAPVAVLLADLDDFKLVNDSLGHPVGDEMLRKVGDRIQACARPGDTVARIGGDEFALLIEDHPETANEIAECIVKSFNEPFEIDERPVYMRLSIGLAAAVGDTDVSADELFKRADMAMYSAKRAHETGPRTFTPEMRLDVTEMHLPSQQAKTGRRDGIARIRMLGDLRRAIDQAQLDLVYQPKFSLSTGLPVGVEALVRWPHPEFGLLEPGDFLPLVRENGLMQALTDLVLARAIEDAAGWYGAGIALPVAINLSAPSLNDEALPEIILAALAKHDMPTDRLSVEITEDLLLASVIRTRTVLDRLREAGIRVAIDDFGSGYSSMAYLHELPIDELKLDRQFIAPMVHDERAAAIVRSVIQLAYTFGLTTVAEGIEDEATADRLRTYGCDLAQGHYFSAALPAKAIRLGITPSEATRPSWA